MSTVTQEAAGEVAIFVPKPITFDIAEGQLTALVADTGKLTIAGAGDRKGFDAVHEGRMILREKRLGIDKRRKELKADALAYGKQVESTAQALIGIIEPEEARLQAEEDKYNAAKAEEKRLKEEEAAKLTQARVDALGAVGDTITFALAGALEEEAYQERLKEATAAHEAKLAREAAEEAERQRLAAEAEKARQEEAARLEAQRVEQEKLAAELKAQQEKLAAQQREIEERNRAEYERLAAEQQKLDDAKAAEEKRIADAAAEEERKAAVEQARKEAVAAEKLRAEKEAAAKLEREKRAEAKRLRAEAKRPDKEKLIAFADLVDQMDIPELTEASIDARQSVIEIMESASERIREIASDLDSEGGE
jgi:hypothetical protein